MSDVSQRMKTVRAQMNEYRVKVGEINVQLVSLRRVRHADKLSRHLQDRLADLTLEKKDAAVANRP